MSSFLKGKAIKKCVENSSIHTGRPKCTNRTPKWPEEHNVVLAELLLEQFLHGNMSNRVLKREAWVELVNALNRRLETNYAESIVMTRFKNMKSDFRTLYQLSNRSGWGWDEELHLPVAPDEVWDELLKATPNLARFRRNPFHQYDTFEKICGENIAIGSNARSSARHSKEPEQEDPLINQYTDDFMSAHGVSFMDNTYGADDCVRIDSMPISRSKRSSGEEERADRKNRRKEGALALESILQRQKDNADKFTNSLSKHCPHSMLECLTKLRAIPNISNEAIIAVNEALQQNSDNKTVIMNWDGELLRGWIEYVLHCHPRFSGYPAWL